MTVPKFDAVKGSRWTPLPAPRWNTVYGSAVAQTWDPNTRKCYTQLRLQRKGFHDAFLVLWHSCGDLYACWGEAGEFGWAAGVLGKATSRKPLLLLWPCSLSLAPRSLGAFLLQGKGLCVRFGKNARGDLGILYKQKWRYGRPCGLRGWYEERLETYWKPVNVATLRLWMPKQNHLAHFPAVVYGLGMAAWLVPLGEDCQVPGRSDGYPLRKALILCTMNQNLNVLQTFNDQSHHGAWLSSSRRWSRVHSAGPPPSLLNVIFVFLVCKEG